MCVSICTHIHTYAYAHYNAPMSIGSPGARDRDVVDLLDGVVGPRLLLRLKVIV